MLHQHYNAVIMWPGVSKSSFDHQSNLSLGTLFDNNMTLAKTINFQGLV